MTISCAPTSSYFSVKVDRSYNIEVRNETKKEPDVGSIQNISPGESLIEQYNVAMKPAIKLYEDIQHEGLNHSKVCVYEIKAGTYELVGASKHGLLYSKPNGLRQIVTTAKIDRFVDGGLYIAKDKKRLGIYNQSSQYMEPIEHNIKIEPVITYHHSEANYKRQIIYTGRSGNTLHLEYREFLNDMARPAFSQELTFDVSVEKVVGYKSALFEVIDASNTSLTYKVIQHLQ